jgi:hypothetical protein
MWIGPLCSKSSDRAAENREVTGSCCLEGAKELGWHVVLFTFYYDARSLLYLLALALLRFAFYGGVLCTGELHKP